MSTNNVAIYCRQKHSRLINYVKTNYQNIISLYDDNRSKDPYEFPRFHYTEINNLGYTIIIDDLKLYDRLKNKNNTIIYYMDETPNHNINYREVFNIFENIDGVLLYSKSISPDTIKIVFKYTKDVLYV